MASSFAPRQEAVPFGWQKLSKDQQALATQVHGWLTELLRNPSAAKKEKSFVPNLDEARASHVLLINGPRGSGKTTMMLSLLKMWVQAIHQDAALPEAWPGPVKDLLRTKRVIPIEIMDMQPLAGHASLLLQLAGRRCCRASCVMAIAAGRWMAISGVQA